MGDWLGIAKAFPAVKFVEDWLGLAIAVPVDVVVDCLGIAEASVSWVIGLCLP